MNKEQIQQERISLLAQIAVKDEALKVSICNFVLLKNGMKTGDLEAIIKNQDAALTNSPAAAKEMVERMERMEIYIKTIPHPNFCNASSNSKARQNKCNCGRDDALNYGKV